MNTGSLGLHSERYGSTGNIGENFRRLLGVPTLDPLQTVIREAVQNIADAALPHTGPEIEIRLRRLTADQRSTLASRVVSELPREPCSRDLLSRTRSRDVLTVMEICDFGTSGLGGPTRSDRIPIGEQCTDFIDFLRNIGTARDTVQGGGTYGFGKVALYRASRCSTIIVDTLPQGTGPEGRRLMGCHVGRSFAVPDNDFDCRYTGRHWWGVPDRTDGVVDPVTGHGAEDLASQLGFPERSADRPGTSIMVLDFDTDEQDLESIGSRVVEGLLWNFWPRMMRDTPGDRRFTCRVKVDGSQIPVPFPEEFPPLDLFSKAMRAVRGGTGDGVIPIRSDRPNKLLGKLVIERGLRTPRHPLVPDGSLFPPAAHHIALMRPIELVVKYLEGTALSDERLEWAGAFVVSHEDEVERAFADSEPPAHDDWVPDNFPPRSRAKSFVNVALRNLKRHASDMGSRPAGQHGASEGGPPLARLAGRLGAALAGVGGDGAGRRRGSRRRRGARPARARASRPLFERLELSEAGTVAVFSTEVSQDARRSGLILAARAAVAIEGSAASRIDEAIRQPEVLSLRSVEGGLSADSSSLTLAGAEGMFEIRVLVPGDCAVTVEADILTGDSP